MSVECNHQGGCTPLSPEQAGYVGGQDNRVCSQCGVLLRDLYPDGHVLQNECFTLCGIKVSKPASFPEQITCDNCRRHIEQESR